MNYYLLALAVFVVDIILYAVLPLYNNANPSFLGLTTFYAYQIIMLIVSSLLFLIPVLLSKEKR
ncbi:MAG: hypothetical protein L7H12_01030 [Sulfolobales archaeon]|nr:hypothetical protein [Sulfolobales archaeon]MCG2907344.1 hypothetical protein [Sulfolobales archaeon]MCG2907510.1 hypothetical protein [Sulfolobales archaeon]